MGKIYLDKDVLTAALERIEIAFNSFDNIFISFSGGKDSSVMVQLAAIKARELNKKFSIMYIDLEAQYKATIDHVEEILECTKDVVDNFYWIAMPLSLRNAVSVIQPKWICWDKNDKKKWVRDMPKHKCVVNEDNYPKEWTWFERGMEFEDFILYFAEWFNHKNSGITGTGVGIRSDESLNRFTTITSDKKILYEDYHWTTKLRIGTTYKDIYNFYPLYDWRTEDIWGAIANLDLKFNEIYELMYKNGVSIYEQRLCQPYGDDQRNGLDQFRSLEPETWEKVLNRVHGVNFGNIYCRTSLLGNLTSQKPDDMSWQQYTIFLLESLGLYAPELRDHYYKKIKTFIKWYDEKEGINLQNIVEEADTKLESAKKVASWRRIARAIEKNDFWMKRLSFGQTKSDVEKLFELKKKYKNIIRGEDTNDKHLKQIAEELNKEEDVLEGNDIMTKDNIKIFKDDYDRKEFYSLTGQFFAEPHYKKELPYLSNKEGDIWHLNIVDGKVKALSSYEIKKTTISFETDYFVDDISYLEEILKIKLEELKEFKKPIKTATSNNDIKALFQKYGFEEYRSTSNYSFLVKK